MGKKVGVKKKSPSRSTPLAQSRSSEAIEKEMHYEAIKDKAVGIAMWVFKINYKSDGTIERFKARLVILGNHQVVGVDYSETFAPVAKMVTVRVFLAIAAAKQWELHQMDVHNTLLHGDLED
ncbi:retrovirus-related pol polyprotein from transposon TNT 1-94 [Tanacetum coccineum]|uniref:Retrovirus-related pol polyprotein from transposon TNT 1-94 n=1 Tax=Tanacetum coccineum TaxID=301880 RepID=A0ABQ5DJY7_9ASTR